MKDIKNYLYDYSIFQTKDRPIFLTCIFLSNSAAQKLKKTTKKSDAFYQVSLIPIKILISIRHCIVTWEKLLMILITTVV